MDVGIGLPATIPGARGSAIVEWAIKADKGLFSSVSVLDRLVYPNYEPMVVLGAAAAVTNRVRLMTAMLAKQAASVDAISVGRLTLGLGIGGRPDDFVAGESDITTRGRRFDEQLATMKHIWAGEPYSNEAGEIGPTPGRPGGPELLIGAVSPRALARVARWGDGFIAGGGGPEAARASYDSVLEQWDELGREGRPRFVSAAYFALGGDADDRIASYINDYYSFMPEYADVIANAAPSSPQQVRDTLKAYENVGIDEFLLWPCNPSLDQVDRLADIL
jgi:alkanesulfonate monooxygenase SsuD/methylene tetrahydromethanopterin reductase-like flavin-dependent oxidoreductase (luciferase family)